MLGVRAAKVVRRTRARQPLRNSTLLEQTHIYLLYTRTLNAHSGEAIITAQTQDSGLKDAGAQAGSTDPTKRPKGDANAESRVGAGESMES